MDAFYLPQQQSKLDDWLLSALGAFALGIIFTQAGEGFLMPFLAFDPAYLFLLIYNSLTAFVIWRLVGFLANRQTSWWAGVALPYGVVLIHETVLFLYVPQYEFSLIEFTTIVLPFSLISIIGLNAYYRQGGPQEKRIGTSLVKQKQQHIYLSTSRGKRRIEPTQVSAIWRLDHYSTIELKSGEELKVAESLSHLICQLPNRQEFFNLNRRAFARKDAISAFRTLTDGRLELACGGRKPIVSKNKAAKFKSWWGQ